MTCGSTLIPLCLTAAGRMVKGWSEDGTSWSTFPQSWGKVDQQVPPSREGAGLAGDVFPNRQGKVDQHDSTSEFVVFVVFFRTFRSLLSFELNTNGTEGRRH
jgi:hypothetical protein